MPVYLRVKGAGGRETARDLDAVRLGMSRQLGTIRREAADLLAAQARRNTPLGPGPRGRRDRLPHIRDTISGRAAGVVSSHPGAVVHEFGGTIAPRGVPIRIRRSAMAQRAAETERTAVERLAAARLDALLDRLI